MILSVQCAARPSVLFGPCARQQQNEHRINLEPPEEHIEAQNDLCQRTEHRKVPRRANEAEARADVIERCENGRHRRRAVEAVERDQKHGHHADEHIQDEVPAHRAHRILPYGLAVDAHDLDRTRADESAHLHLRRANENHQPRDLEAAARRACARRERCGDQQEDGQAERPGGVVDRCVARRRDDGDH